MTQSDEEKLSAKDLRDAGIKAFKNASELVEEAGLLYENGHWSRAVFLCCISGEELGKCFMSLSEVVNRMIGRFDEKHYRQRFRTHREKTGTLTFFEGVFVSQSDESLKELEAFTKGTETMKLASLYCDFYGVVAQAPSELIPEKLATEVLKLAKNRVKHFRANVRPKLDQVLKIDPKEIEHFRNEFLRTMADAKSDVDC